MALRILWRRVRAADACREAAAELFHCRPEQVALDGAPLYARTQPKAGEKLVLVIGNEARGVSPEVQRMADVKLKIPMRGGAESLNAAVAAGILMYEVLRHNSK